MTILKWWLLLAMGRHDCPLTSSPGGTQPSGKRCGDLADWEDYKRLLGKLPPHSAVLPRAAWVLGSMWRFQAGIIRKPNPTGESWHFSTRAPVGNLDFRGLIYWPSVPYHVPGTWAVCPWVTSPWGLAFREVREDQGVSLKMVRSPTLWSKMKIGAWRPAKNQISEDKGQNWRLRSKVWIYGWNWNPFVSAPHL